MNIKAFYSGTFGFLLGVFVSVGIVGCASQQQTVKTVKDSIKLAEDACVILHDVAPDNKAGQEICAKEAELQPFVKLIVGARARQVDAGTTSPSK